MVTIEELSTTGQTLEPVALYAPSGTIVGGDFAAYRMRTHFSEQVPATATAQLSQTHTASTDHKPTVCILGFRAQESQQFLPKAVPVR
jgi:hypothetical protein